MSQLQWKDVSSNFNSSNKAMSNATASLSQAGNTFDNLSQRIEQREQNAFNNNMALENLAIRQAEEERQIQDHNNKMSANKEIAELDEMLFGPGGAVSEATKADGTLDQQKLAMLFSRLGHQTTQGESSKHVTDMYFKLQDKNFNHQDYLLRKRKQVFDENQAGVEAGYDAQLMHSQNFVASVANGDISYENARSISNQLGYTNPDAQKIVNEGLAKLAPEGLNEEIMMRGIEDKGSTLGTVAFQQYGVKTPEELMKVLPPEEQQAFYEASQNPTFAAKFYDQIKKEEDHVADLASKNKSTTGSSSSGKATSGTIQPSTKNSNPGSLAGQDFVVNRFPAVGDKDLIWDDDLGENTIRRYSKAFEGSGIETTAIIQGAEATYDDIDAKGYVDNIDSDMTTAMKALGEIKQNNFNTSSALLANTVIQQISSGKGAEPAYVDWLYAKHSDLAEAAGIVDPRIAQKQAKEQADGLTAIAPKLSEIGELTNNPDVLGNLSNSPDKMKYIEERVLPVLPVYDKTTADEAKEVLKRLGNESGLSSKQLKTLSDSIDSSLSKFNNLSRKNKGIVKKFYKELPEMLEEQDDVLDAFYSASGTDKKAADRMFDAFMQEELGITSNSSPELRSIFEDILKAQQINTDEQTASDNKKKAEEKAKKDKEAKDKAEADRKAKEQAEAKKRLKESLVTQHRFR